MCIALTRHSPSFDPARGHDLLDVARDVHEVHAGGHVHRQVDGVGLHAGPPSGQKLPRDSDRLRGESPRRPARGVRRLTRRAAPSGLLSACGPDQPPLGALVALALALAALPRGGASPQASRAAGLRRGRRARAPRRGRARRGRAAGDGPLARGLRGRGGRPPPDGRVLRAGRRAPSGAAGGPTSRRVSPAPASGPRPRAAASCLRRRHPRRPPTMERVRPSLRRFLETDVREGDWVTLVAPEQQLWWTARNGWEYRQLAVRRRPARGPGQGRQLPATGRACARSSTPGATGQAVMAGGMSAGRWSPGGSPRRRRGRAGRFAGVGEPNAPVRGSR